MFSEHVQGRVRRVVLVAIAAGLAFTGAASADTFKPTRFDDPMAGECKPNNCSLREAIGAANDQSGRDAVVLQDGTYEMEIPGDVPVFDAGDLEPSTPMELRGKGAGETKIDANGIDRVISIGCGISTTGAVSIKGVTLRGGDPGANPINCTDSGSSIGGGILTFGKALSLQNVAIRGNAAAFGGGIRSSRTKLTIKNSAITNNNAGEGGGLDLRSGDPQRGTVIRSSTISGNSALKGGGVLADGAPFSGADPSLKLLNSTVAGNMASAEGGGIMGDNAATITLDNTTVAYNQANSDNVGLGDGGGVYQHSGAAFELDDSLVAANTVGQGGDGPQCAGEFDVGFVVVQNQAGVICDFSGSFSSVADALIGPLANNGGPTKTVGLQAGSPAINNGAINCPARDQRGKDRPNNDDNCDTGAFERKASDP